MRALVRHRQRSQTIALAAVGMMALVGALSMVVDAGLFFIAERNMQNAADAAVLAAVWYSPACDTVDPGHSNGCQLGPSPDTVAHEYVDANLGIVNGLCGGPENLPHVNVNPHFGPPLNTPHVSTYVVSIDCNARHWFTGIFPDLPLTKFISVSSAATIGWPAALPPHDVTETQVQPTDHLIARLIGAPH